MNYPRIIQSNKILLFKLLVVSFYSFFPSLVRYLLSGDDSNLIQIIR